MCENIVYKYFVATNQGRREYMEDFVCTKQQQPMGNKFIVQCNCNYNLIEYFAVFDGHGGPDAAIFAQNCLLDEISKQTGFWSQDKRSVSRAITNGFISTTKAMWNAFETWPRTRGGRLSTAGTTASIVMIRDQTLYVANVGDSTIVLGELAANGCCVAKTLTVDHKPDLEDEKRRIQNDGGDVMVKAGIQRVVWKRPITDRTAPLCRSTATEKIPFLAISRALGDLWSYNAEKDTYVVSPEPDVTVIDIDKSHCFIILATDGLWHVVEPAQAVDIVAQMASDMVSSRVENRSPAEVLVQLALQNWARSGIKADNISVVVIFLENCKILGSSAFTSDCSSKQDVQSIFSVSNEPLRNLDNVGPVKRLHKNHHSKKSHLRKPLTSINTTLNNGCSSAKRRKHKFKIPTTPEQRSTYWNRRVSNMTENLPLYVDLLASENPKHSTGRMQPNNFMCKHQSVVSITAAT